MKTIHRIIVLLSICAIPFAASARHQKITFHPNPGVAQMPGHSISVALVMAPEIKTYNYKATTVAYKYDLGEPLTQLVNTTARESFRAVATSTAEADAVLECKPIVVSQAMPAGMGKDHEVLLVLQWVLKDKSGRFIWLREVRGMAGTNIGSGYNLPVKNREMWEAMLDDLHRKSVDAILNAPPIKAYKNVN